MSTRERKALTALRPIMEATDSLCAAVEQLQAAIIEATTSVMDLVDDDDDCPHCGGIFPAEFGVCTTCGKDRQ